MIGKGVGARQGNARRRDGRGVRRLRRARGRSTSCTCRSRGADRYTEGAYATGNRYNGIRDFLAGRPMGGEFPAPGQNPDTDPLNYGDFGFDIVGTEVHADGEIWVAVEIDLRDLFLQRVPVARGRRGHRLRPRAAGHEHLPGRPPLDPGLLRRDGDDAARPDDDPGARRDARRRHGPLRRGQPGPDLAGLRDARLRPDTRTRSATPTRIRCRDFSSPQSAINNATMNFSADSKDGSAVPVNAKIYVGDYSARVDADRGHRPGHGQRRHERHRQPRQHGAVRPDRRGLARPARTPLVVLQLRRRRARLRPRAIPGEAPGGRARFGTSRSTSRPTTRRRRRARRSRPTLPRPGRT